MNGAIESLLREQGTQFVRFVDIAGLPGAGTHRAAVLFGMALSPKFILDIHHDRPTDSDEYLLKEEAVENLADALADRLTAQGYAALSQSERRNMARGQTERGYIVEDIVTGPSLLPQKRLARMAGLGFIGRNNLLVTREYGCAVAICSVLTAAPVETTAYAPIPVGCDGCDACVRACPAGALSGALWSAEGGREALFDKAKCCCPLRCMMACTFTLRYAHAGMPK